MMFFKKGRPAGGIPLRVVLDPGGDLLSRDLSSDYHRRANVSLPGSGWDRVGPLGYDHQATICSPVQDGAPCRASHWLHKGLWCACRVSGGLSSVPVIDRGGVCLPVLSVRLNRNRAGRLTYAGELVFISEGVFFIFSRRRSLWCTCFY